MLSTESIMGDVTKDGLSQVTLQTGESWTQESGKQLLCSWMPLQITPGSLVGSWGYVQQYLLRGRESRQSRGAGNLERTDKCHSVDNSTRLLTGIIPCGDFNRSVLGPWVLGGDGTSSFWFCV